MSDYQEYHPLLRSMSEASVSFAWFAFSVGALVVAWCVLDSWSHETVSGIFNQKVVKDEVMNPFTGQTVTELDTFSYTLTLAFLQFVFVGVAFCSIFAASVVVSGKSFFTSLAHLRSTVSDRRWPALVGTHMFGSVLLQSLMMPTNMMSLGFFAATRAVEIPVAAGARAKFLEAQFGRHQPLAIALMFAAAWLLFYSYTQIAECLCVWSGFGVALTGLPLYFVYALLITIPASNVVFQECVLVQLQVHPFLMLGVQNLCAAILFLPILLGAHWFGFEDVRSAILLIMDHRGVYMTVVWLCMQTAVISAITAGLISMVDSFWTVSARSLRVVFWWIRQLPAFYLSSDMLLSVAHPHASLWSFGMVCGLAVGISALLIDHRPLQESTRDKHSRSPFEQSELPKGLGMGRYA